MTRALFILTGFALLFLDTALAQAPPPDPRPWLKSGPMVGYATLTETALWVQTNGERTVQFRFWEHGQPDTSRLSGAVRTSRESDHIAKIRVSDLRFGARYDYELYLDGHRVVFDHPLRFQTQAMWNWRTDPPAFRMTIGSCTYVNDPLYDRPGTPYGSGMEIFEVIADQNPDLMLWIGDNVYLREGDWEDVSGIRRRYAHTRALPEMQPLLASTHNYATWDDHDFGPNDSDRTYALKDATLATFRDYWLNRSYGLPEVAGVFHRFTWQDVEIFMLDDRFWRSPNAMPSSEPRTMLGDEQLQWLRESLASSKAPFKIVVNGNQILNPLPGEESLRQFDDFERLTGIIRDARIDGVMFVSGDLHYSVLMRDRIEGIPYPLYDLTASPLTAGNSNPPEDTSHPTFVPGTIVEDKKNFARIDVSGPRTDRTMEISIIDIDGTIRWTREIRARDLRFPRE